MTRPTFQRLLIKHLSAYKINKPFPHSHLFTKSLIYGSWRSSAWFQERSKCLQLKSVTFAFAFLGSAGLAYWASGALTSKDRVADVNKTKSELNDNVPEVTIGRLTRDHSKVHRRFVYSPLDHGYKTRLLILEPGNFDDEVTCQLKHSSSLKHDPEYEALSYAWGDPTQTCVIKCNDRELPIPAILYEALRGLRYETDERVLWADAVCINQEDPEERGHQVQIMQEIYSNAQRVIVWLGEEKVEDQFAFDSLRSLDLYLNDHTPKPSTGGFGWFVDTDGTPISGPDKENLSEFKWGQIANLLRRQWFRRTWVIQEVASARQVILKCSSQEMQWRDFANAFMQLDESGLRVNILEEGKARHARESIAAMETLRRSQNGPMSMSLLEVLLGTCYNNCSDPRDKIYAVLGLATDWSKEQELKPDYTIGAEEAFQNLAVWDICHNVSLRVLSCASGPEAANDLTLPSWVPDWRHVENAHPFIRYSDRTHFSAAGRTSPVAWFSSDRNVLHIVGKYIDTLRAVGSVPNYTRGIILASIDPTTVHLLKESWRWLQECQKIASENEHGMSGARFEEFWRTMTCGLTKDGFPAPPEYADYFSKYMQFAETLPERWLKILTEVLRRPLGVRGISEANPELWSHALIESSLAAWSSRRRLGITESGGLACVPSSAAEGDVICVLFGSDVPYVLRPAGNGQYIVVGECFVNGIMHGEALSKDGFRAQEFQLR